MQRLKAAANAAQVGATLHRTCLELQREKEREKKKKEHTATVLNKSLLQNQIKVFPYNATAIMNKSAAAGSAQLLFSGTHGQHKSQVMALLDAILCRSCPGMFTVVAVHQARFICTLPLAGEMCRHVCTAKPFWPSSERPPELGQGHSSVDVFNCTCDGHGRVLSKALPT